VSSWPPVRATRSVRFDAWTGYDDIGRNHFQHVVTNLSESGDPAHVVLPHVHRFASPLKRWILGTHQGAVSHSQLDSYDFCQDGPKVCATLAELERAKSDQRTVQRIRRCPARSRGAGSGRRSRP